MSWFTKWSFKNKAAISIMSVLILAMGIVSYFTLPMEFLPAADNPQVSIVMMGHGTDANTMEETVTTPIEDALASAKGKKNIFSTTGDGYSKIDIFYDSKTDMKEAKKEVQDLLHPIRFPETVGDPIIVQLNTSMIPISEVAVTFEDGVTAENLELAKKEIIPYFKDIPGVASVQTFGTINSYVSIDLDNEKLAQNQLTLPAVMTALQGQNQAAAIGEKIIDDKTSNIKVISNITSLEDFKNIRISPTASLKDIATVELTKPETNLTRINGEDGVFLVITKDSNSNAVSVSKDVREAAKEVNKEFPNAESKVVMATADMVENSVHSMIKEVLLGALFATIVIMLFLRNIRSTFITIVSIPLSLCLTLFLLSRSGVTLNILTLGGVAVAVGRLVDDSIVVIENIFRKMQDEKFSVKLIIDATKEVGSAITSSTLTTVAVFLPIGLVSGSLQDFLLPFALTVSYSLLTSLLVALTVVPLMSAGLLKNAKLATHQPSARFKKWLTWSLNHKWVILLLSFVIFAGSIGTFAAMPKGAVDHSSAEFVMTTLKYPNNTPIEDVRNNTLKLEEFVNEVKGVKYLYTQLGSTEDSAQFGEVASATEARLSIIPEEDADMNQLIEEIETQKDKYPGAEVEVMAASLMGGSSTNITIDVVGNDIASLEVNGEKIKEAISDIDGVEKVETNIEEKKTVYSFEVNTSEANTSQVAGQLAMMLNQTPVGTMEIESQQTPIILESSIDPEDESDLKSIPVITDTGIVKLSDIAELKAEDKSTTMFHKDGDAYIRLTAEVDPEKLSSISAKMNETIFGTKEKDGLDIPKDVDVLIGGASAQQAEDFTDIFITMLVSIGIVFLIMVITFKTIRAPIAILCSLPLAAIGAVLGLLISGITVDITALLGGLMLIGVVVTNAIVLLDRVRQNEKTMIIRDAIVEAASIRMRPIIMTAVATICAMIPLLFKQAETGNLVSASLAIVVIGGLSVATLLTLVVIPVIYELLHFKKARKQRLAQETVTDTEVTM
jgi:multidrug efflux pump subunit AcrB